MRLKLSRPWRISVTRKQGCSAESMTSPHRAGEDHRQCSCCNVAFPFKISRQVDYAERRNSLLRALHVLIGGLLIPLRINPVTRRPSLPLTCVIVVLLSCLLAAQ